MKALFKNIFFTFSLIFLVFLSSADASWGRGPYIDPLLQPYVDVWVEDCKEHNIDYKMYLRRMDSIKFENIYPGYLGVCYNHNIYISKQHSPYMADFYLLIVVYHELGHCAFDYEHDDSEPAIMNSSLSKDKISNYWLYWPQLKTQYFDRYERPTTKCRKN